MMSASTMFVPVSPVMMPFQVSFEQMDAAFGAATATTTAAPVIVPPVLGGATIMTPSPAAFPCEDWTLLPMSRAELFAHPDYTNIYTLKNAVRQINALTGSDAMGAAGGAALPVVTMAHWQRSETATIATTVYARAIYIGLSHKDLYAFRARIAARIDEGGEMPIQDELIGNILYSSDHDTIRPIGTWRRLRRGPEEGGCVKETLYEPGNYAELRPFLDGLNPTNECYMML